MEAAVAGHLVRYSGRVGGGSPVTVEDRGERGDAEHQRERRGREGRGRAERGYRIEPEDVPDPLRAALVDGAHDHDARAVLLFQGAYRRAWDDRSFDHIADVRQEPPWDAAADHEHPPIAHRQA